MTLSTPELSARIAAGLGIVASRLADEIEDPEFVHEASFHLGLRPASIQTLRSLIDEIRGSQRLQLPADLQRAADTIELVLTRLPGRAAASTYQQDELIGFTVSRREAMLILAAHLRAIATDQTASRPQEVHYA